MTKPLGFRVERVFNVKALALPAVMDLLETYEPDPRKWEPLAHMVMNGTGAIFIGGAGSRLTGIAMVTLPDNNITTMPQVIHFYCSSGPVIKKMLIAEVLRYLREHGYSKYWALNYTGRPDSIWVRAFKGAGRPRRVGSVIEFDLSGDENERRTIDPIWGRNEHTEAGERDTPGDSGAARGLGVDAEQHIPERDASVPGPVQRTHNRRRAKPARAAAKQRNGSSRADRKHNKRKLPARASGR